MLIYVAHPYGGKEENKKAVEEKIKKLVKKTSKTYIHKPYSHIWIHVQLGEKDYDQGMRMCLALLRKCDRLILCEDWNSSKGCNTEFEFARKNGIKAIGYKEALNTWKF